MALLFFDPDADHVLAQLESDASSGVLLQRVNEALDWQEADSSDPRVRRMRFRQPALWCVTIVAGEDEWAILWEPLHGENDAVVVRYLGPASFA